MEIDWSQQQRFVQKKCAKCYYTSEYEAITVCPYEDEIVHLQ